MTAIRLCSALALATAMAGCTGTNEIGPTGVTDAPAVVEPVETASNPVQRQTVIDLPRRVAAVPQYTVPAERAAPVVASPAYQPMRPAPVAEPVYETVMEAVADAVVETVTLPIHEAVEALEPVALPAAPAYTAVGGTNTVEPEPTYEMAALADPAPSTRSMAPIRDEPLDGRNSSGAETRVHARKGYRRNAALRAGGLKPKVRSNYTPAFGRKLEQAALDRLNPSIRYDARYVKIGYPWGDVPEETGVCSDVIIRSYRALGVDLQRLVHEDMKRAFRAYPSQRIYGLRKADPNIDHRRVVNLEAFFERTGASIPVGTAPDDFQPGDVLTWRLSGNEPHTGIVIAERHPTSGYPLVVHNLGAGVRKDDLIKLSRPEGHFRFAPDTDTVVASLAR